MPDDRRGICVKAGSDRRQKNLAGHLGHCGFRTVIICSSFLIAFPTKLKFAAKLFQLSTYSYNAMTKIYYRGAQAAIVCYDIAKANTFAKAKYWIREVRSIEEDCKIYLCGTKKDLYDAGEKATPEIDVVETYADGVQAKFYMTSSKTGENVGRYQKLYSSTL